MWIDQFERKFEKFTVKRLMYYIISINFLIYIMMLVLKPDPVINALELNLSLVLKGELWRLITFVFIPPNVSPVFILFTLYFYYLVGVSLEDEWGSFRFNIYYYVGMLATIVLSFFVGGSTGVYLNLSLFLAFAYLFPDFQLLIFFILPVKVKYIAGLYWMVLLIALIFGNLSTKAVVLASVVNFFLFFTADILKKIKLRNQVYLNRKRFFSEIAKARPIHQCQTCGKTEKTNPKLDFSYCKECDGDYEYCPAHLENHKHIKK